MKPLLLFLLFWAQHAWCQGLLLNPNFDSINVCFEYESECSFKAWYPIRHGANVLKQSKKAALLSMVPQLKFEGQNRTAVVGCLTLPILPGKELELLLDVQNPREVYLGVGFINSFDFDTQDDLSKLDSIKFEVLPLSNKEKQTLSITPKDTALFVVLFLLENNGSLSALNFKSIDARYKVPENDYYYINFKRLEFIMQDRRRHLFSNTQRDAEIMNAW